MRLDDQAVDCILGKVGKRFVPTKLDRTELRKDLNVSLDFYEGYDEESNKGRRTARRAASKKVASHAAALVDLLQDPSNRGLVRKLSAGFPHCEGAPVSETKWDVGPKGRPINIRLVHDPLRRRREPSFGGLVAGLTKLAGSADIFHRQAGDSSLREFIKHPPLLILVGATLGNDFERHFHRKAGFSRRVADGAPDGPYVRFARAVMDEYGTPVSANTVATALSAVRATRSPKDA